MAKSALLLTIITLTFLSIAFAFGPLPSQDFCVADLKSSVRINGLPCKDPGAVTVDDFFSSGLHIPGNTSNPLGSAVKPVGVNQIPALNTLDLSIFRMDFAPNGFVPPHHHHRATEFVTVLEGSLEIGFVTSYPASAPLISGLDFAIDPDYKLFSKVLQKGDSFVVPIGLIHYAQNAAPGNTVALVAFNGQNVGINLATQGIFGSKPSISSDYLAKAFLLDKKIVEDLQTKFQG